MSGLFRGSPEPPNADGCSRRSLCPRLGSRLWVALAVAGTLTCGEGGTEPVNRAPSAVGKIPGQVVAVDSAVVVDARPYFADPDGDTLVYAASSSGTATAAVAVSGSMVTVTGVAAGSATVTVTARDPEGLTAEHVFGVTVPNRAPAAVGTIADQSVYVDSTATVDVAEHFTDPDGDPLEYSAASSDATRATVAVSGSTVTVTGMALGSTTVTVTARDTAGLAAEQRFEVTVPNRTPEAVGTIEDREVEVDSVAMVDVATYFTDPDRDSLEYSASSSDTTRATVEVSGSEITVTGLAAGSTTVMVMARDPGGLSAEQRFGVTVPNRAPLAVGTIADQAVHVDDTVAVDLAEFFADPDGDALEYAAASSDTTRAAVSLSGSMATISGAAVGSTTVAVTARDTAGLAAEQRFGVTVPNRAPVAVGTIEDHEVHVSDTVVLDVASYFTDADREELGYAAGASSEATVSVAVSGSTVTIAGMSVGSATVTVTAEDPGGLRAEQVFGVTVPNRAPVAVGTIAGREVEVDGVATLDVAQYFTDPDGQALGYSATSSEPTRAAVAVSGSAMTVTGVAAGRTTVTVRAEDPGGLWARQSFEVLVPNRAPVAAGTIEDREVYVGDTVALDVAGYFTDPDGDTLTYAAVSADATHASVSMSGSAVTVRGLGVGDATVTVTARDPEGLAAEQRLVVTVPNRAPVAVGTIGDREVHVGDRVAVDVAGHFTDPDGQELVYTAESPGSAMVSVAVSGSTVTLAGMGVGGATVTVTAQDPGKLMAEQRFRVTVPNRAPEAVGTIANREVAVDRVVTLSVAGYFRDRDGEALEYSAVSSDTTRATVLVSGSTLTLAGVAKGTAAVTVTARDPGGLAAEQHFRVTVPNRAPEAVGTILDQEVHVGGTVVVDVAGYFTDPDGEELGYTAVSSSTTTATAEASGNVVTVAGVAVGTLTVTVTARDPGGLSAEQRFQVAVPNRAPETVGEIADQSVELDSAAEFDVAEYFTDPDGETLEYSAASSDTTTATVAVSGSLVTLEGMAVGTAFVTVTARDPGDLVAEQAFELTVPNRPPEPVGTIADRVVEAGSSVTVDVVAYFTDPDGDTLQYGATSSDASRVAASVSDSVVTVRGAAGGSAIVTVTAWDPGGLTAGQTFEVTVPNQAPEAVGEIGDMVVELNSSVSLDVSTYFTDPDGEVLTYDATSSRTSRATVSVVGAMVTVTGQAEGTATITVTARDPDGLTARQRFGVTVLEPNRAPEPVGTIPDRTVEEGEEFSVDVEPYFRDPDGDELDYSATSSSTAVATVDVVDSRLEVESHDVGEATITVTATDPGGLAATQTFDVEVEAPPNRAPYVAKEIDDLLDATSGEKYRALLTDVFVDPDGDPLDYTASSSDTGVAEAEVVGDTIFVTAVDVGTATVTVTATDPGGLSATDEFEVTVIAARFDLWLGFTADVTETQRSLIRQTRARWESILLDTELNDIEVPDTVACLGIRATDVGEVDDHLVLMDVDEVDSVGGTLAYANYCYRRLSDGSPIVSAVVFDKADIDRIVERGSMGDLTFHEIAHGLGFLFKYWDYKDLLEDGDDPHFKGELAIEAFDDAGGEDYEDEKVPISSPDYSHWRKSVFGREGMTATLTPGVKNPFSAITLQAMADVDYEVDESLADDYELPSSAPPPGPPGEYARELDLSNDVARTTVMVLGPGGRIVRVIQPPPGQPDVTSFRRWREARLEPSLRRVRPDEVFRSEAPVRKTVWRLVR